MKKFVVRAHTKSCKHFLIVLTIKQVHSRAKSHAEARFWHQDWTNPLLSYATSFLVPNLASKLVNPQLSHINQVTWPASKQIWDLLYLIQWSKFEITSKLHRIGSLFFEFFTPQQNEKKVPLAMSFWHLKGWTCSKHANLPPSYGEVGGPK